MLDRIISNILKEITEKEDYVLYPEFSEFRISLSAEAADYFVNTIFTQDQAQRINEGLNTAYKNYCTTFGDKKRSNAEQEEIKTAFINEISRQCIIRINKYVDMDHFNFGITQNANDANLVGNISQYKTLNWRKSFKYGCSSKSLALFALLTIIIVLALVYLSKDLPILATLIIIFSIICCGCVCVSGVVSSTNRWTRDILENQMRQVLKDNIYGQGYSNLNARLQAVPDEEDELDLTALARIREVVNLPGIANFLITLDREFSRDLVLLTATFVYPPDLMPIFAASVGAQYNPRSAGHEITFSSDDDKHDPEEKQEEAPETAGNTDDPSLPGFNTAGMQLDIIESDSDTDAKQSGGVSYPVGSACSWTIFSDPPSMTGYQARVKGSCPGMI